MVTVQGCSTEALHSQASTNPSLSTQQDMLHSKDEPLFQVSFLIQASIDHHLSTRQDIYFIQSTNPSSRPVSTLILSNSNTNRAMLKLEGARSSPADLIASTAAISTGHGQFKVGTAGL